MRIYYSFFVVLLFSTIATQAQINTPSPSIPFGTGTYNYGMLPTNLPTSGTYGASQDAANAYNTWKTNYITDCNDGTCRVNFDNASETVSEGIAYGMLLAVYAGDQDLFDCLWAYYKKFSNSNGVMNWKINGCTSVIGTGGAADAEIDAAMALIVADCQWPGTTSPHDYADDALALITAIKDHEIQPTNQNGPYQLNNGDQWGFGNNCRNPGYQAPAYYQCYATYVPSQATLWGNAYTAGYALIDANVNTTTGLVSNWSDHTGSPNTCNGANEYGWDACRNPWRMATDVMWHDDANAKAILEDLAAYIDGVGASNIAGPVAQSGGTGSYHNATFVSTFAAGLVGAPSGYQSLLNAMYTETVNTTDNLPAYFGNTLRVLSLFVMTGNFWKPCNGNACPVADLMASPTSGTAPLLVSVDASNSTDVDGDGLSYAWDFGDANNGVGAMTSHTYTSAGNYTLRLQVSDGTCTRTETTTITVYSGTPQAPVAIASADITDAPSGTTINFDGSASYDLNGDNLTYTWDFGDGQMGTGANPSHAYDTDGIYTVTLTVNDGNNGMNSTTIMITIDSTSCVDFVIQYRDQYQNATNNQNEPGFIIVNNTNSAVPLTEFSIRYWFTSDGISSQQSYVDWADVGTANVNTTIVQMATATTGADHYLEVSFTSGAGNIAANSNSGAIQTRFNKTDWSNYDETDDYSYNGAYSNYADWDQVGLYRNGVKVCGEEPSVKTRIELKVFLQGAMGSSNMEKNLHDNSLLPLSQPYTSEYLGTESVSTIPADVVDWVMVEVRAPTDNTQVIARRACFLRNDGQIVDLDGTLGVEFTNLEVNAGYVVVRHRNHLGVMTASTVDF